MNTIFTAIMQEMQKTGDTPTEVVAKISTFFMRKLGTADQEIAEELLHHFHNTDRNGVRTDGPHPSR